MIRSMTGYGKAEVAAAGCRLVVEVRSVNHRYGEIFIKLPRSLMVLENDLKKIVGEKLKRGKIEVFVHVHEEADQEVVPAVNLGVAKGYLSALTKLRDELGLLDPVTLEMVVGNKDILSTTHREMDVDALKGDLVRAMTDAVAMNDLMRVREGSALLEDLLDRRGSVARLMDAVKKRAPVTVVEHAARLKERLEQLTGGLAIDEARLAQEVALIADRGDITEEIVRFASHLQQVDEALTSGEPVGRKLDFLLQELNREVNTIGSKANDVELSSLVVELKAELEKIREQIQNVE